MIDPESEAPFHAADWGDIALGGNTRIPTAGDGGVVREGIGECVLHDGARLCALWGSEP